MDGHAGRYATWAKDMAASQIRALFAVAARPETVSLAGGMPCVTALPLDAVGDMTGRPAAKRGAAALDAARRNLGAVCRDLLGQAAARGT